MPIGRGRSANESTLTVSSTSVGASPVTAYMSAPLNGRMLGFAAVLRGTLTGDATITVTNTTTSTVICTLTVPAAGSGAGISYATPQLGGATSFVHPSDVISIVPSGGTGATIGADYRMTFQAGGN